MVKIIIGESEEQTEVTVKDYPSGVRIVGEGEVQSKIKGQKPLSVKKVKVNKTEKKELMNKPDKFKISKGRLVRKPKKK